MHELSVTKSILDILLKHAASNDVSRVINVRLKIGELSDLEGEWIQHYFDYLSKGTVAQGAVIKIKKVHVQFSCDKCFGIGLIGVLTHIVHKLPCKTVDLNHPCFSGESQRGSGKRECRGNKSSSGEAGKQKHKDYNKVSQKSI